MLTAKSIRTFVDRSPRISEADLDELASQILSLLDKRMQRFDRGLTILHGEKQADRMR